MNFLKLFLRGVALLPGMVQGVESIFGAKTGKEKRDAALEIASASIHMPEAIANKTIVDGDKFSGGLSMVIDGVVACLNASVWAKP